MRDPTSVRPDDPLHQRAILRRVRLDQTRELTLEQSQESGTITPAVRLANLHNQVHLLVPQNL